MEATSVEVSTSRGQMEASIAFGNIIHRVAVRIGGKSKLGRRIGVDKEFIQHITKGGAHVHDKDTLMVLIRAVKSDVHRDEITVLNHLVKSIVKGDS